MIDLLYLSHNRREFTEASIPALIADTDWSLVRRLILYDDDSGDGTREYLSAQDYPVAYEQRFGKFGGPVAVMIDYLTCLHPQDPSMFAKIDSDTMVPSGWLNDCLRTMDAHPELGLLGIEAFHQVDTGRIDRDYEPAEFIGGIGLMRSSAFVTLPRPNGRFGFTAWQDQNPSVLRGFVKPSLPVFLLDRLPREPWLGLSREYVTRGWQRPWAPYDETYRDLWSWWCQ